MRTPEILKESTLMLYREPLLFAPKILSTLFSSLVLILLLSGQSVLRQMNPLTLLVLIITLPVVVTMVGVVASITVAGMVKHHGEKNYLGKTLSEVGSRIEQAFKAGALFTLLGILLGIFVMTGYYLYQATGNLLLLLITGTVAMAVTLGISYAAYFLPATLLEFGSLKKSFHDSYTTSNENSKLVTLMIILSVILLGLAFLSSGTMEKLGYTGFVAGRLVSSVVNTYVFVLSPNLYYSTSESSD